MRESTVAHSYAEALFALGEKHGQRDAFAEAVELLAGLIDTVPQVRTFIETPLLDAATKKQVLRDALGSRVPPLFLNFLFVVLQKRRQRLLRDIARAYRALIEERLGRLHVDVTMAREPDADTLRQITEQLTRTLDKAVVPHVRVAPEILGGVILRYGDRVLDGSLRRRLLAMRRRLLHAELPSLDTRA